MRVLLLTLLSSALMAPMATASDIGTYRPGNSYLTVPAQSPDQCRSQCSGDAQCKSWNFVRVAPNRNVCEFNTRKARPIASNISISGEDNSAIDSARIIPTGFRTTRVGTPQMPTARAPGSVTRVGAVPNRQAITTLPPISQASHRRVQQPAAKQMPFRHSLDSSRTAPAYSRPTPPPRHSVQAASHTTSQGQQIKARPAPATQTKFRPMLDSAPQASVSQPANVPAAPPRLSQMPQNKPNPSVESGLAGGPVAAAPATSKSLYGSLFDDVKAPRALSPADIPSDPDAPIPTATSVPIERIDVSPL